MLTEGDKYLMCGYSGRPSTGKGRPVENKRDNLPASARVISEGQLASLSLFSGMLCQVQQWSFLCERTAPAGPPPPCAVNSVSKAESKAKVPQVHRPQLQRAVQLAGCLVVIDSVIQRGMVRSTSSRPSQQEVNGPLATELTTVTCTAAADT